jgi:3-hydroxyethyl bacteriochlorophyllide a dehydrogenase
MFETSKAIIYSKANKIELKEMEHLPIASGDVSVKTYYSAITPGLERLVLTGKSITRRILTFPIVPGSELVGEVIGVGKAVTDLAIGDKVYVGKADKWFNALALFGCQAERVLTDRKNVIRLGQTCSKKDLLIGSLAYAISAVRKINFETTQSILVLGLGSVGLMVTEYLKYKGLTEVDATEKFLARGKLSAARDIAFDLEDFTSDYYDRYDVIVEATGRIQLLEKAVRLLKPQGKFLLLGNYETLKFDYRFVQDKEPVLIMSNQVTDEDLYEAKYLLSEGEIEVDKFLTHTFEPPDFERAYEAALNTAEAIKTVIQWA